MDPPTTVGNETTEDALLRGTPPGTMEREDTARSSPLPTSFAKSSAARREPRLSMRMKTTLETLLKIQMDLATGAMCGPLTFEELAATMAIERAFTRPCKQCGLPLTGEDLLKRSSTGCGESDATRHALHIAIKSLSVTRSKSK